MQTKPITVKKIDELLSQYDFIKNKTILEGIYYSNLQTNEVLVNYRVPDVSFPDFHNFKIVEGRFFNEKDYQSTDKICVIEQQLVDSGKFQYGSNYMIENEAYKIVGVIYTAEYRSKVFLPKLREADKAKPTFYDVTIRYDDINNYKNINWGSLNGDIDNKPAIEYRQDGTAYAQSVLRNFGVIALILMLYCVVNSYNIIANRINVNSANYGIYLSVGASPKKYTHKYLQKFLFML